MKTFCLLLLSAWLLAQSASAQNFRLGAKTGLNYATVRNQYTAAGQQRALPGPIGGITARWYCMGTMHWHLQAELLYSAKGDRLRIQTPGETLRYRRRLHYLDLPVMMRMDWKGFTAEAGPQVGYLLGARNDTPYGVVRGSSSLRRLPLGYVAGLGYESRWGVGLTLRYNADLTSVGRYDPAFGGARNAALQVLLGYTSHMWY